MAESIAVMITKPPYGTEEAFAGLRLSLAMIASGLVERSSVVMVGDGTLNAVATQDSSAIGMPSNAEAIIDLIEFDAEVYCVQEDFEERASGSKIVEGVQMISWEKAREIIHEHDMVTTF